MQHTCAARARSGCSFSCEAPRHKAQGGLLATLQETSWAEVAVRAARQVSSMPYLKGESPSLLETYVPKITEAYLTSR